MINKIDLAPYVGVSLEVMDRYTLKMRGNRPFVFSNLKTGIRLDASEFYYSGGYAEPLAFRQPIKLISTS